MNNGVKKYIEEMMSLDFGKFPVSSFNKAVKKELDENGFKILGVHDGYVSFSR